MSLRSYSFNEDIEYGDLYYRIWNTIQENKGYFLKYCGRDADEAMQMSLLHSLTHFDPALGNLKYYILSLARDITRVGNKLVFVDFLDRTLESEDELETRKSNVDTGSIVDFSDEVIHNMYLEIDKSDEIADLALSYMEMFLLLCESLITRDSSTTYYSKSFISECLDLSRKVVGFNDKCIELYETYGDAMKDFLSWGIKDSDWREADYGLLSTRKSRKVVLVDDFGIPILDADKQVYKVSGRLDGKRIVRVRYSNIHYRMCSEIIKGDITKLKFSIGDRFIVRTYGGSVTLVNPNMVNVCELIKMEIITNILQDTNARYLNIGSDYIYMLVNDKASIPERKLYDMTVKFNIEEVMS